jgi:putative nucleotidyltransferase with HDIG domain
MLSRDESIEILDEYGKGATWVKHCLAVANSASRLGQVIEGRYAIDRDCLWSTALLHDIGR